MPGLLCASHSKCALREQPHPPPRDSCESTLSDELLAFGREEQWEKEAGELGAEAGMEAEWGVETGRGEQALVSSGPTSEPCPVTDDSADRGNQG